jgi:hypothetical protein
MERAEEIYQQMQDQGENAIDRCILDRQSEELGSRQGWFSDSLALVARPCARRPAPAALR